MQALGDTRLEAVSLEPNLAPRRTLTPLCLRTPVRAPSRFEARRASARARTYELEGTGLEGVSLEPNLAPRRPLTPCVFWRITPLGIQHPPPFSHVHAGGTGAILGDRGHTCRWLRGHMHRWPCGHTCRRLRGRRRSETQGLSLYVWSRTWHQDGYSCLVFSGSCSCPLVL